MLQNRQPRRNFKSFRHGDVSSGLGKPAMAATAAKRTTVRLSSGISANILDFGIPQKRVLTETPAMETSGKAGGGEVPTCQTAPRRQARDPRVDPGESPWEFRSIKSTA
jgi:hypothetical protein